MAKLNYFELMTDVNDKCLSEENFALLCEDYCSRKTISAAQIIQKKWKQSKAGQITESLDNYGGEVYSSNLWSLYFEVKEDREFHKEVEDLLFERACREQQVFDKLPHSLSSESEIRLVSLRTGDIVPDLDWAVAATSYAIFADTPNVGAGKLKDNKEDELIAIHRFQLDALFGNLKSYLAKFPLSKPTLLQLIEIAQNGQRAQAPHFSYDYLILAVNTLALYDDYDALDNEGIQQKLLNITVWNVAERCVDYLFKRPVLSRYNMSQAPSEAMVKELLSRADTDFIREVLSHSWLANGKEAVLQQHPEFSAEVLLADLAHDACLANPAERKYSVSLEYWNLVLSKREISRPELQPNVTQDKLSVLNLCLRLYNTYSGCHFDSENRSQIMNEAIHYCEVFGGRVLKSYIPQLQEAAKEEKHRIYCL